MLDTEHRYGSVTIALHWSVAVLLIALVISGLYMVQMADVGFDIKKITLILYHKELGVAAFALAIMRLAWRLTNVLPRLAEHLPDWEKVIARFVHLSFYALMLALPITGWLMSSAAGIPVSFLGWFNLPDVVPYDNYLFQDLIVIHRSLAYVLILLIVIHAGAALRHHLIFRDDTLRKMLPDSSRSLTLSLFFLARIRRRPSAPLR